MRRKLIDYPGPLSASEARDQDIFADSSRCRDVSHATLFINARDLSVPFILHGTIEQVSPKFEVSKQVHLCRYIGYLFRVRRNAIGEDVQVVMK